MQWISHQQWDELTGERTDAHRVCTHSHGWLDRYGYWVLETRYIGGVPEWTSEGLRELFERYGYVPNGWLAKALAKAAQKQKPPVLLWGQAPGEIVVLEHGLRFNVVPGGGYSSGLFLDQRLNRRWVMSLKPRRMLNLFAYTGSFSVCAAAVGAETMSVDVSKRALSVARSNFAANNTDVANNHRFISEDVTRFVPRLRKRGVSFDLVVLDPPTFGRADGKVFRLEHDLPVLVRDCWELLVPGGWMLVSCNYAKWGTADLRDVCLSALSGAKVKMQAGETPPEIPIGAVSWRLQKSA